jgi:hypothetical protein
MYGHSTRALANVIRLYVHACHALFAIGDLSGR